MTNPTPHGQVPEALIELIDEYAETRHRCGGICNAKTEAARKAVIEALSGVQALSAAPAVPAGWKAVPVNPTPEMWKAAKTVPDPNPPYPPHYGLVWDAMLAASPTSPAEQQAPSAAAADTVVLEAALRAIHQAIDLIGEPDTERLRTVRRVLRGAVIVAEDAGEAATAPQPAHAPAPLSDDVMKDAARWRMAVLIGSEVMLHPNKRTHATAVKAYMDATDSGSDLTGAVDAALAAQGGKT